MARSRSSPTACRSRSRRSVVTSNATPSTTTVTVPCAMPVGIAFKPALRASAMTLSGTAVVAKSTSSTRRSSSASRTAPPTARVSISPPDKAANTRKVSGRFSHAASFSEGGASVRGVSCSAMTPLSSVDAAGFDHAIFDDGGMVSAAAFAARELHERRHDDEQQTKPHRQQPEDRRTLPQSRRRGAPHPDHVGRVDQERQRKQQNIDEGDAQHRVRLLPGKYVVLPRP